jgi:hypothetical protein
MAVDAQLQGAVCMFTVSLGILGNIPVILSIFRKRSLLKNNHYYLILHLAICDFLYLSLFTPVIYSTLNGSPMITSSSYLLCKIWWPAHTVVFTAGGHFLVLISILRYRAIVHPLEPAVRRSTLKILSTLVYVLAIIYIIPYVLVLELNGSCEEEWPVESLSIVYTVFLTGIQYFIPVAFLSIIYYKICTRLIARNNTMKTMDARNQTGQEISKTSTLFKDIRNIKTFLVSFTIVACFTVSACPMQVMWIVAASSSSPSIPLGYYALTMFGTSVINPYVYGALDMKVFSFFKPCRKR